MYFVYEYVEWNTVAGQPLHPAPAFFSEAARTARPWRGGVLICHARPKSYGHRQHLYIQTSCFCFVLTVTHRPIATIYPYAVRGHKTGCVQAAVEQLWSVEEYIQQIRETQRAEALLRIYQVLYIHENWEPQSNSENVGSAIRCLITSNVFGLPQVFETPGAKKTYRE